MSTDSRGQGIRPYGDTTGDGAVQLSFTLPIQAGALAREAARQLCAKMGINDPSVVYMKDLGQGYTFFVMYGRASHEVDISGLRVPEIEVPHWDMATIDRMVLAHLRRPIAVIGANTGHDAHTVGLDAILNAKGSRGDYGLERYSAFRVLNLGSQVPNELLVAKARELGADAILVSKVVTQKNIHLHDMTQLVDLLEAEGMRDQVLLVAGGPRITHELAVELGFDAGFGPGTAPSQVAAYLAREMLRRAGEAPNFIEL